MDISSTSSADSAVSVENQPATDTIRLDSTSPTLSPIHSLTKEPTFTPTNSPSTNQPTQVQESTLFPPSINICNVDSLSFNTTKMIFNGQYMGYIPRNGTNYAYGPFITKSASTTVKSILQYIAGNTLDQRLEDMNETSLDEYKFISILRHPMDRALAGFHQIEVFWRLNWIDGAIDRPPHVSWWNQTCLNATYGVEAKAKGKYQCQGSLPETTTERRLQRLNDFLDELDEKGFWDQHITPVTYLISKNKLRHRATYYDLHSLDNVTYALEEISHKPKRSFSLMKRGNENDGMDWIVKWNELVNMTTNGNELAKLALMKLCTLYRNDVQCLPYDIPECKEYV